MWYLPPKCNTSSNLFVQDIPQMHDWIEIWVSGGSSLHHKLVVKLLKPFLKHFCFVAGGDYPADRGHSQQAILSPWKAVHSLQQCLGKWHPLDFRTQGFSTAPCSRPDRVQILILCSGYSNAFPSPQSSNINFEDTMTTCSLIYPTHEQVPWWRDTECSSPVHAHSVWGLHLWT